MGVDVIDKYIIVKEKEYRPLKMFVKISDNAKGIDYICGDIHGCIPDLYNVLGVVDFNFKIDRLFTVGDITDRGLHSDMALQLVQEPWFYSVRGNHEDLIINAWDSKKISDQILHMRNGGGWFWEKSEAWQSSYVDAIKKLPIGLQVGNCGIVHADYGFNKWDLQELQNIWEGKHYDSIHDNLLWDRITIQHQRIPIIVSGIDYIYCGHTIIPYPEEIGNIRFIDTGAYTFKGYLTLFKLHWTPPDNHMLWYVNEKTS